MKLALLLPLLKLVLPVIAAQLTFFTMQGLKAAVKMIDAAPPTVKQALVLALSFAFAGLAHFIPDLMPGQCLLDGDGANCLRAWSTDTTAVQALISFVLARALHAEKKLASTGG